MENNELIGILLFALVVAAGIVLYKHWSKQPQTRADRKLAKLNPAVPVVTVTPGAPRMVGRPRMDNVREVVIAIAPQRPSAATINTILHRQGLTMSSIQMVRSLARRLVKRGLLIKVPQYPGAPSHQQVYCYAPAPCRRSR